MIVDQKSAERAAGLSARVASSALVRQPVASMREETRSGADDLPAEVRTVLTRTAVGEEVEPEAFARTFQASAELEPPTRDVVLGSLLMLMMSRGPVVDEVEALLRGALAMDDRQTAESINGSDRQVLVLAGSGKKGLLTRSDDGGCGLTTQFVVVMRPDEERVVTAIRVIHVPGRTPYARKLHGDGIQALNGTTVDGLAVPRDATLAWLPEHWPWDSWDALHLHYPDFEPIPRLRSALAESRRAGKRVVFAAHDVNPIFGNRATHHASSASSLSTTCRSCASPVPLRPRCGGGSSPTQP